MATQTKQGGFHYAFLIVAACVCMCAACSLMVNCAGVYLKAVSGYFGASSAQYMLYFTIMQLTMTITLPIAGQLATKLDLRVLFTISALLCFVGNVVMASSQALWMLYIGGFLQGVGTAPMLFLAVPRLIGAWCHKRVGFFTGLALAFTGIGGVIFNPVQSAIINMGLEGWRTSYLVAGVILLILTLPFTIFVVRNSPADKGLLPYGAEDTEAGAKSAGAAELNQGILAGKAMKTTAFYAVALMGGLFALNQSVYQLLPSYASSFEASAPAIAALSATIASVCMAGLTIGKIALGAINDRSAKGGVVFSIALGIVGVLLMMLFPTSAPLLLAGSFFFGFVYAGTTVESTLVTRSVFGNRDYANIYSRVSMVTSLGGAFGATLWGIVVDLPNGFNTMFMCSLGVMVVTFLLAFFALSQSHKYAHQEPEGDNA